VYLDNNATTPVDPRVLETMLPYFCGEFGNASSTSHTFGWNAASAVEAARSSIARSIGARYESEIIFTSGATESVNLAVKGARTPKAGRHIITSRIEHKAVLDSCHRLESCGVKVTSLPVDEYGLVDLNRLEEAITDDTYLVSIMLANNEIGTVQDVATIGKICRQRQVLFHTDATQGVGKIPFSVIEMNVDMASFTAHKLYGPKGVGALYLSREIPPEFRVDAQIDGGGHERGYRSGTLNVPGIVGFAKALELCVAELPAEAERIARLRDRLHTALTVELGGIRRNGHPTRCLPGLLNISFASIEADSLLLALPDLALSSGSACTSASIAPSHVLTALGLSDELAQASVRFGIGRFNAELDIEHVANRCITEVGRLRAMFPSGARS
jgi:cysteine desulfurase